MDHIVFVLICHSICFIALILMVRFIGKKIELVVTLICTLREELGFTTKIKLSDTSCGLRYKSNGIESESSESSGGSAKCN